MTTDSARGISNRREHAQHGRQLAGVRRRRRRAARRPRHAAGRLPGAADRHPVTVIVPAHNEEEGIRDTLDALLAQTVRPARIIVVDDCSSDRTPEICREYPVTVLRPPQNLGSKAKAQNYALPYCVTELVLPVDADTVLAPDYLELVTEPFDDPRTVVAAGCVQTRHTRTVTERGRQVEYLFGFHFYRPIQHLAGAPVVCSGCCSAFRRAELVAAGGFPERTIVEDMDYTWTSMINGRRAVYVSAAEAYAADPETPYFLRKQVWRWMAGFFQNVRIHWRQLYRKPMLALWVVLALIDLIGVPLWYASPALLRVVWHEGWLRTVGWWLGADLALTVPALAYAALRRRQRLVLVLGNIPCAYFNRVINNYYAWKALIVELILVPLGLSAGLTVYEKGH
jgi:N-acetylglucosaminyltransferase